MKDRVVRPASGLLLGCVVALAVAAGPAQAQQECEEFTLVAGEKSVEIVDNGKQGDSAGDVRIVTRNLLSERGEEFGVSYFVSTVLGPGSDGHMMFMGNSHIVFRDGEIVGQAKYERQNDTTPENPKPVVIVVQGGTGIYKDATGTVEVSAGADPMYAFKIDCS